MRITAVDRGILSRRDVHYDEKNVFVKIDFVSDLSLEVEGRFARLSIFKVDVDLSHRLRRRPRKITPAITAFLTDVCVLTVSWFFGRMSFLSRIRSQLTARSWEL